MSNILVAFLITTTIFISITLLMVRHGLIPAPIERVETFENSVEEIQSEQDSLDETQVFFGWKNEPKVINPEQVLIPDQINNFREFKFTEKEKSSVLVFFDYIYLPQFVREQLGAGG